MQAETLASAYRLWRRNWKGKGREYTAGALVWQINDCWPVSWNYEKRIQSSRDV
jgi:beta-mannosidase